MKRVAGKIFSISAGFFFVVASVALCGCAKPHKQTAEAASQSQATQPTAVATEASKPEEAITATPPHTVAIQAAITRVYEGTVTLDQNRFLVGDFDKDGSQDLVAVVRPIKEKLAAINDELARWKLEDPHKVFVLRSVKDVQRNLQTPPDPVIATQNDLLLAVVHGHGPYGWRNTEATNAFLLKNAVGTQMTLEPYKGALAATRGKRGLLTLRGDVIKQTLGRERGFIFWTGAAYGWHSLNEKKAIDRRSVAAQ